MDEIEKRLRETSDACIKCYEAWRKSESDDSTRESLHEAIHELRKVGSRLEIEMAISERSQMAGRPIPIPPHRASRIKTPNGNGEGAGEGQDDGAFEQSLRKVRQRRPNNGNPPKQQDNDQ